MEYDIDTNDLNISSEGNTGDVSTPPAESQPAPSPTFKYTASGREIEEPIDTILKRASMGYNYAQHMEQFKRQQSEFETQRQQVDEQAKRWREYDDFARQNPDWANHVRQAWENRNAFNSNQQQEQSVNNLQLPPEIAQELNELKQFKQEWRTQQETLKREREDMMLNEQIDAVRKEYPDIDLSMSDPSTGKSLEWQILEHAQGNGISNFKSAFRDFYHDKLLSRAVTRAKEESARSLQERQQKGFIATSDSPQMRHEARDHRSMSYFDLVAEGAKELGI